MMAIKYRYSNYEQTNSISISQESINAKLDTSQIKKNTGKGAKPMPVKVRLHALSADLAT